MMSRLQKVCNELTDWGTTAGLTFNAAKTEVVIFTKKRLKTADMPNKLLMQGIPTEFGPEVKYLGVTVDSKLSWNKHIQNITTRAKKYLFTQRGAVQKSWGPKPNLIRWIYTAIVRPRIAYASISWGHTLKLEGRKDMLNKLNRLAAAMITPVRRSTPIKALEIIYDLIPLHLFCQQEALASMHRNSEVTNLKWLGQSKTCKSYIGHRKHLSLIHI